MRRRPRLMPGTTKCQDACTNRPDDLGSRDAPVRAERHPRPRAQRLRQVTDELDTGSGAKPSAAAFWLGRRGRLVARAAPTIRRTFVVSMVSTDSVHRETRMRSRARPPAFTVCVTK